MAIQLLQPSQGWKRYDNIDTNITYFGSGWGTNNAAGFYNNTNMVNPVKGQGYRFNFTGNSIRLLVTLHTNRSESVYVYVDGKRYSCSQYGDTLICAIGFELLNLGNMEHYVQVVNNTASSNFLDIDAIDVLSNCELRPYNENLKKMLITNNQGYLYTYLTGEAPVLTRSTELTSENINLEGFSTLTKFKPAHFDITGSPIRGMLLKRK